MLFVLSFNDDDGQKSCKQYYLPSVEIKDCNVNIDERNFVHRPINNDLKTYDNIRKFATGQGDDYITGFLLDYIYSKKYYKLIAVDLSKQQKLDTDPQINFTGNLARARAARIYFIIEEVKETILDFLKGMVKVL